MLINLIKFKLLMVHIDLDEFIKIRLIRQLGYEIGFFH